MYKVVSDVKEYEPDLHAVDGGIVSLGRSEPVTRPVAYLFGSADSTPNMAADSPERDIRYQRGSAVYATDGPVGTLRQMVIDEDVAEVKALVIQMAERNESVLMPPELVDKCVGKTLLLNVTKAQFAKGASRSPRFDPKMFTGVDARTVAAVIPLTFRGDKQRSVVNISPETLQTSEILEPSLPPQTALASRSRWKHLRELSWRRARPAFAFGSS